MAEYIDREKIPWAKVDHPKGNSWDRIVFESAINNITPADVIEREKIDKAIKEMDNIDLNEYADNTYQLVNKCIEILKSNIGD